MTQWEVWAIKPAAGTNYVTNPSAETGITGFSGSNATVTQSSEASRFGAYSVKAVPTGVNTIATIGYQMAAPVTGSVTFSVYVKGVAGKTYTVKLFDDDAAAETYVTFTSNGYWQRRSATLSVTAGDALELYVYRDANQNTTAPFYTDGWQLEAGDKMTTYIDGDLDAIYGHLRGVREYYWTGTPHASTSKRISQTSSGGELVKLSTFCKIIAIIGLGLPQINALAADITTGGGLYQGSRMGNRDIEIKTEFTGETPGDIAKNIASVAAALDNTSFPYRQPLRLYLTAYDAAGTTEQSETTFIDVAYTGGLEGGFTSYKHETKYLTFRQYDPAMQGEGYTTVALDWQDALDGDCLVRVTPDGVIDNFGITSTVSINEGYILAKDPSGNYILGGAYTDLNGIAGADYIAKYTASTGAWGALVALNSAVHDIVFQADGKMIVAGAFVDASGVATADKIARWTGSAWESITTGGAADDSIYALAYSRTGTLYAGGAFTTINGVTTAKIARWDGTTWAVVGSAAALNGDVYDIIPDPWGDGVIVAGAFTNAGGVAAADYLARVTVSGTTYTWSAITTAAPDAKVLALHYDEQAGRLYIGGDFANIGSAPMAKIAYYDGSSWREMGTGFSGTIGLIGQITSKDGLVYTAINGVTGVGGVNLPDGFATWNGNQWYGQWFDATATHDVAGVYADADTGDLFWMGTISSATVLGDTVITNSDTGDTWPTLSITGPGTVYGIRNFTTGEVISFNGLTLRSGEYMTVIFGPDGIISATAQMGAASFQSRRTATRDLRPYIVPGSSATLTLVPGNNTIGLFIYGSTNANTAASLSYPTTYRAIEASVR